MSNERRDVRILLPWFILSSKELSMAAENSESEIKVASYGEDLFQNSPFCQSADNPPE